MEGLSEMGRGFLLPKNADGVVAREPDRLRENGRGLAAAALVLLAGPAGAALGGPPGVKVLAAGLGLNSIARTLNLEAREDVGAWLFTGLVIRGCSFAGPVGGPRAS